MFLVLLSLRLHLCNSGLLFHLLVTLVNRDLSHLGNTTSSQAIVYQKQPLPLAQITGVQPAGFDCVTDDSETKSNRKFFSNNTSISRFMRQNMSNEASFRSTKGKVVLPGKVELQEYRKYTKSPSLEFLALVQAPQLLLYKNHKSQ